MTTNSGGGSSFLSLTAEERAALKAQREASVTGHDGTTIEELLLVCAAAPLSTLLYQQLQRQRWKMTILQRLVLEAVLILVPMTICQTEWLYPWGCLLLAGQAIALLLLRRAAPPITSTTPMMTRHVPFLTCHRASVYYMTFIAILAVDFPSIFPRRFAKTETHGYGLMDLGAAAFVIAAHLRRPSPKKPMAAATALVRRVLPVLALGWIRWISTKSLEYQEHVSEYGTHWNFFFTLAVLQIVSAATASSSSSMDSSSAHHSSNRRPVGVWAVVLLVLYQTWLSWGGLQEYMETAPRNCSTSSSSWWCWDVVAANREGLGGCLGYLSLLWASQAIATHCLSGDGDQKQKSGKNRWLWWAGSLWGLHAFLVWGLQIPTSRRTTNASFVVWTLAHNLTFVACLAGMNLGVCAAATNDELAVPKEAGGTVHKQQPHMQTHQRNKAEPQHAPDDNVPLIFQATNRNGLVMFVIANLLTGAVNLIHVNTLQASAMEGLVVVSLYVATVAGISLLVDAAYSRLVRQGQKRWSAAAAPKGN